MMIDSLAHSKITTSILPVENLRMLMTELEGTIYTRNPHLVYELGSTHVLEVDTTERMMTLLLLIPHVGDKPDGFVYYPLVAPPFQTDDSGTFVEKLNPLTALIDIDHTLPPPNGRQMMGINPGTCSQKRSFLMCTLSNHVDNENSKCSNALLQNVTESSILSQVCDYRVERSDWVHSSFITRVRQNS